MNISTALQQASTSVPEATSWQVPEGTDEKPVREFSPFTGDLEHLAEWLISCGITTVAMESTGVYWIPVFEILESHGLEVKLVNARHVKNVPGTKSDVLDCQWL